MAPRFLLLVLLPAFLLSSPAKKVTVGSARGENEDLLLSMTLYTTPADVKEILGDDLGGHYIVAEVKVEPKYGKTISIDRDDFVLHTDVDGARTTPFAPSQIAGSEALIVTQNGAKEKKTGIMIGGIGGGVGGGGGDAPTNSVKIQHPTGNESPLEKLLKEKILVEQKTDQPVGGLLYFPMEKQKLKNLEVRYGPTESRITLRFKP